MFRYVILTSLLISTSSWAVIGVLAEGCPTSVYRLITDNPTLPWEAFRILYGNANPEPKLGSQDRDNEHFIKMVSGPRNNDILYFHGGLKPLKQLNDKVFTGEESGGKKDVDAARNLFRIMFFDNLNSVPMLKKALVGQFIDFKSMEMAFDPGKAGVPLERLRAELDHVMRMTQIHYDTVMIRYLRGNPVLRDKILVERGLTGDTRSWHLFGTEVGHPDLAAFAARRATKDFNNERGAPLISKRFTEADARQGVDQIETKIKKGLIDSLGKDSRVFQKYEKSDLLVLSHTAIDILRKVDAKDEKDYVKVVTEDFKVRLGVDLTREQVLLLRDYYSSADDFQPPMRVAKREKIELEKASNGVTSVDFAAQNVVNMYHTMGAIASAHESGQKGHPAPGTLAIGLARLGEEKATVRLKRLQRKFDHARNVALLRGEYQRSGDDGVVLLKEAYDSAKKEALFRSLLKDEDPQPDGGNYVKDPVSDYRIVFVPTIRGTLSSIDSAAISREIVKGETFEKALRKALFKKLKPVDGVSVADQLRDTAFGVDMDPINQSVRLWVVGGNVEMDAVVKDLVKSDRSLIPTGYRLDVVTSVR